MDPIFWMIVFEFIKKEPSTSIHVKGFATVSALLLNERFKPSETFQNLQFDIEKI